MTEGTTLLSSIHLQYFQMQFLQYKVQLKNPITHQSVEGTIL